MTKKRMGLIAILLFVSAGRASAQNATSQKIVNMRIGIPGTSREPAPRALALALISSTQSSRDTNLARHDWRAASSDTLVRRNRALGGLIGGAVGLVVGGVVGYQKGDPQVAFDQATGAAIYGLGGAAIGAIIGVIFAPRVP